MKDKSKLIAIILAVIAVIILIVSNVVNNKNEDKKSINIVTNYSNFYTVNSCLYRFITYLSSNDKQSLLLVLDENYKKKNKVNENNVIEIIGSVDADSTFVSQKMYYERLNKNITKYYVYGNIEKNQMDEDGTIDSESSNEKYFIVYLDSTNKTFSVEPYSGEIFNGGEYDE